MVVTGRSQLATSVYWTTHYVVLAAFIVFALFPLFWLLKVSVTPTKLLYTEGIRLWPSEATWANYGFVLTRSEFPRFFMNSVIVSGSTAILVTIVAAGAGYAFSRFAFRGKVIIVALMLITQMFPLVMLIAPIFKILSPLGLTNSLTGLVIVYSAFNVPFAAFLMQSFFDQIPRDLEEAAMIDGDTRLGALWRIVLPLTLPGVGATLGFVFTAAWSELLFALMLISKAGKQTFPVGLLSFVGKFSVDFGQMMAAVILALIPVCLFFVFIQRYLVQGLTAGAVKVIRIMASVEIAGVHKSYGPVPVLHGVDLGIEDGEFIVLVGPSGCGKSTLLRMIAGLEEISAGSIRIGGAVVNDLPPRARDIAMVFQSYALYPHMNVAENMSYSLRLRRAPRDRIADTVRSAAEKLGLGQLLERRPRALSGGQRQRVAMGRAIVRKPKAFLFDEPLSNLDARLREQMRTEIKKLHRELGTTSVYVTHDQIEAMTMADRIVAMHHGIVQQIGTPLKIYDRPANIFVASFIGSPAMNLIGVVHKRTGSGSAIDIAGADFPLAKGLAVDDGAAVLAGVRPEHLRIVGAGNGRFAGRIELIEPMGLGTLIHANVAGQTLKALSFERVSLLPDMPVGIGVDADHIHLFDARTEQRLN